MLAEVDPRVTYDHESETAQALSDFDAIVTAYEPRVRSALRMGRAAPVDTDDLVQEVFTRLLIRLRGPGRICVGAWLWRVSRNVAIDASRRRVPVPVADDVLDRQQGEGLDTYALRADLRDHVRTILAEMPERQQQALIAMLKAGPRDRGSCVEVAAVLGVSVEAAESLLSRGRRHMRAELARLGLVDAGRLGGLALLGPLMGHLLRTARRVTAGRAAAVVFVVTAGAIGAHHAASSPPRPLDHSSGGSAQPSPPRAGRPSASAIGVVALSSAPRAAGPLSSTASPEGAASSGATLGVPSQRSLIALIASAPLLASAQNQVTGLPVGVSPSDPAAPLGPAGAALASAQARFVDRGGRPGRSRRLSLSSELRSAVVAEEGVGIEVAGRQVMLSHPDKVLFEERGDTKLDLVSYYLAVGEPLMRAMQGRPVLLQRFPHGATGSSFFQKRVPPAHPDWLETAVVSTPNGTTSQALVIADLAHVVWAVNLACLGFHVWPTRVDDLEHADELRIDLDPTPGVSFAMLQEAAKEVRTLFDQLGVVAMPKTTGNRGIHVYVRLEPLWTSYEVRSAAVAVARELERRRPDLLTAAWWKEERGQRVFVDFNQNAPHKTIFGAWSVRARPGAQVSTPFAWDELDGIEPDRLTIASVPGRLADKGDPWAPMAHAPQSLEPVLALHERDQAAGLSDAPWPPVYPKMPGEPPRVAPSRARKAPSAD